MITFIVTTSYATYLSALVNWIQVGLAYSMVRGTQGLEAHGLPVGCPSGLGPEGLKVSMG